MFLLGLQFSPWLPLVMDWKAEEEIKPFLPELLMVMVFITTAGKQARTGTKRSWKVSLEGLD